MMYVYICLHKDSKSYKSCSETSELNNPTFTLGILQEVQSYEWKVLLFWASSRQQNLSGIG